MSEVHTKDRLGFGQININPISTRGQGGGADHALHITNGIHEFSDLPKLNHI